MKSPFHTKNITAFQYAGWMLVLAALTFGCGGDTPVLITLTGDIADVGGIDVTPTFQGNVGQVRHLDSSQRQLGLWIPSGQGGTLHLEAMVENSKLGGGTRGPATADVKVEPQFTMPIMATIDLSHIGSQNCPAGRALSQITPALGPTSGGIILQLDGECLTEGTTVTIAGVTASDVAIARPGRMFAVLPPLLGALGKVAVELQTHVGPTVSRGDLFSYYASQLNFSQATYSVGTRPWSVAVGDFNRDRKSDVVVVNSQSNSVSVLLGRDGGKFDTATNFPVGMYPQSVVVGDFNRDQILDLAVASFSSSWKVSILLGDGMGSFGAATGFPNPSGQINSLAMGDFNGDKIPDLVVVNLVGSNISVLLGDGMGGLGRATTFPVGLLPQSAVVGDFNGDQKPDLAVTNHGDNTVSVLLGNGMGGFASATSFPVVEEPFSIAVGEFNQDQKSDLAVAQYGGSDVSVLLNDGYGRFPEVTTYPVRNNLNARAVAVGDFNGDQKPDLAVATDGYSTVSVLLGDGMGGLGSAALFPGSGGSYGMAVIDANGDQRPDIVVADERTNSITLLTNISQ